MVVFTGILTHDVDLGQNQAVMYDKVLLNVGRGYNSKTGHFVAPVSGIYSVSASVLGLSTKHTMLEIVKDGEEIVTLWAYGIGRAELATHSIHIALRRGEAVWVMRPKTRYTAHLYGRRPYNSFSVALLHIGNY